jgi:hypothetical protein
VIEEVIALSDEKGALVWNVGGKLNQGCFMSYAFRTSGNAGALSRSVTVEVPMVGSASASRPTCFQGDKRMTDANIMKANANVALISSGYDAFARGDVQGALAVFAQDILWHIPGRGPLSRDYRGQAVA